ncbi:MAG: NGG1p interacting factor NIF3 [Candidatus Moranbacteria bacterium]|nr:NGG1p interacting factor NIF3 [Candidatus Moranbacteria bacterium]
MKLKDIYKTSIKIGIKNDFRSRKLINEHLKQTKKKYDKLDKKNKALFDKERLTNPYSDTRIHFDSGKSVKKVLVGIDITVGDLLIAKELGADLVINHHPIGCALQGLDDVMQMQADILAMYGVPINIAQGLLKKRISEVARGVHASNSYVTVDAARNLGISFLNIHTPADNSVSFYLQQLIKKKDFNYVSELMDFLNQIPEYQEAARRGSAPTLYAGTLENRVGKIAITEMTGGTEGSAEIYEKLANAGIGTVVSMHQSEKNREKAEKAHINMVIASHIASDSIGMNLILDEFKQKGLEIIPAGGFIRVSRTKKNV